MPTFDFQCRSCQHVFEFARPFGSNAQPACPSCSSKRVEKLIAPPAVHFKGSGWYKTDSRGDKRAAATDKEAGAKGTKVTEATKVAAKEEKVTKEKKTSNDTP